MHGEGQDIVRAANITVSDIRGRGDLDCRELVVQSGSDREYFLYVYKCGDKYTRSFWIQQSTIFLNGLLNRNTSGALIRVSTPANDDLQAARERASQFLAQAVPYLDEALP